MHRAIEGIDMSENPAADLPPAAKRALEEAMAPTTIG